MNIDDIPEGLRCEYEQECPTCLMTMTVLTQRGNSPEYETEIYVQCSCGEYIEFILPVN